MGQFRMVHIGVSAALAAATVTAIGLVQAVGAESGGTASVFVPITPCRLLDTRAGADNVGARNTPLAATETATFAVWGSNGNCAIPTAATGIATNATAVNPTAASYVTIFPADANPRPTASNLNVVAGGAPAPNQVTVGLSIAGAISIYNNGGTIDMIIDIVGYYQASLGGGAQGPAGPQGPPGIQGPPGMSGADGAPGPACPTAGCTVFYTGDDAYNQNTSTNSVTVEGCLSINADAIARLNLNLPKGAKPVSVRLRYQDTSVTLANKGNFRLDSLTDTGTSTPRSQLFSTSDTTQIGSHDLVLNATIPAQSASVRYQLYLDVDGAGVYFCGADVVYQF